MSDAQHKVVELALQPFAGSGNRQRRGQHQAVHASENRKAALRQRGQRPQQALGRDQRSQRETTQRRTQPQHRGQQPGLGHPGVKQPLQRAEAKAQHGRQRHQHAKARRHQRHRQNPGPGLAASQNTQGAAHIGTGQNGSRQRQRCQPDRAGGIECGGNDGILGKESGQWRNARQRQR